MPMTMTGQAEGKQLAELHDQASARCPRGSPARHSRFITRRSCASARRCCPRSTSQRGVSGTNISRISRIAGNGFGGQHVAPAGGLQPGIVALGGDEPVDEVDEEHAADDRELVEGDQLAADRARGNLGDVQRREHRGDADSDAAEMR